MIARKGQKKIRYCTSRQKSQIKCDWCGSATGQVIIPYIIFASEQISPLWTKDGVNGSRFAVVRTTGVTRSSFIFG